MTRRKRSHLARWALAGWAVLFVAALAITIWHVIGWLALTAALTGAGYLAGRRHRPGLPARGKLARNAAYGRVRDMDVVSPYPADMRRARANGWTAPGRSVLLSAECAADECVWCHDSRCQHGCNHPSRDTGPGARQPVPDIPQF